MINFSNRIPIILDLKGWTQVDLAQKSQLPTTHLNRILKGQIPRLDTAFKICQALKLPIEKVFIPQSTTTKQEAEAAIK